MKVVFKVTLFCLLTSAILFGQTSSVMDRMEVKRNIFDKSFTATKATTFVIDIEFTTLFIKESSNGKVNIKYDMAFNNYRKKQIDNIVTVSYTHLTLPTKA